MSDFLVVTPPKLKELIAAASNRCGNRVHVWFPITDSDAGFCTFDNMHQLAYDWPSAKNYWVYEKLLVLRRDGLFLSCCNRPLGHQIPNPYGIIEVRSQWALRPIPESGYRSIHAIFHLTPSHLETL